ncbi:MAG: hypothetical protein ABF821_00945 [Gluconacetobacter sp.]
MAQMKGLNIKYELNQILTLLGKANLAFSGFVAAIAGSSFPTYHVLMFSSKCGERMLARIAYDHFSLAIGYSFFSFILSVVFFIFKTLFGRNIGVYVLLICVVPLGGAIYYNYKALIPCVTFIGSSTPHAIAQSHRCAPEPFNDRPSAD